jgi:tetratricopeptide (TPR) repeat protein
MDVCLKFRKDEKLIMFNPRELCRVSFLALSLGSPLSLAQQAPKAPSPPPPSTGKEAPAAPRLTVIPRETARKMLEAVLGQAAAPNPECARLVTPRTRALLAMAAPDASAVKANLPGFLALARCAEKQEYFGLMKELASAMLEASGDEGHPELLARALLGLEAWGPAARVVAKAEKRLPNDPDVALIKAKLLCRAHSWNECLKASQRTIELGKQIENDGQRKAILNRAFKYVARAFMHVGKLDEALKVADSSQALGGDAADLEAIRQGVLEAQNAGAVLDIETPEILALGTYHLIGKVKGMKPLVEVAITRTEKDPQQYRVEVEIAGVTTKFNAVAAAMSLKEKRVDVSPPLKADFNPASVRAPKAAQLDVTVTAIGKGGDRVVLQRSFPITLQPRDFLPLASFSDKEELIGTLINDNIAAWVTPNAKGIDAFLAEAKKRAPRQTFAGEQTATGPQVKALYDELQARGISYVMDPEVIAIDGVKGQRTRLPVEVLATTNAQCLEGTLLYATLFEAIGLKPVVVLVPGHAFVGWQASPRYDNVAPGTIFFLETTMTHDAPFASANQQAMKTFAENKAKKAAQLISISELRRAGVSPQPYEN